MAKNLYELHLDNITVSQEVVHSLWHKKGSNNGIFFF